MINFTWWVNLEDEGGKNVFEGGFLGLDNIGPIDRSHLPVGGILEQSDATGWMGFYAIALGASPPCLTSPGSGPLGPGTEVPRALRRHPRRAGPARACGTRRTGCTTTGW